MLFSFHFRSHWLCSASFSSSLRSWVFMNVVTKFNLCCKNALNIYLSRSASYRVPRIRTKGLDFSWKNKKLFCCCKMKPTTVYAFCSALVVFSFVSYSCSDSSTLRVILRDNGSPNTHLKWSRKRPSVTRTLCTGRWGTIQERYDPRVPVLRDDMWRPSGSTRGRVGYIQEVL